MLFRSQGAPADRRALPRTGDHDLARRRDEHVGAVHDAAGVVGVAQHVERAQVVLVEPLVEVLSCPTDALRRDLTGRVRQRRPAPAGGPQPSTSPQPPLREATGWARP